MSPAGFGCLGKHRPCYRTRLGLQTLRYFVEKTHEIATDLSL